MPSVHRDSSNRSPYWQGSYRDEKGKWRLRSTKQRDRAAALAVAERWQREADLLRKSERLQNKEAVLEMFVSATQRAEQNDFSEATARNVLNEILTASGQNPMARVTVRDFLSGWIESKKAAKAKGTSARYQHTIESFLESVGKKADASLSSIIPRDIERFRDGQLKEGKSAATANMTVKTLRIPFNLARRQGLIFTNPAEAVDMLSAESGEKSIFTADQLATLLAHADTEWRGMILLGATCGMRIGDAAKLSWANIDLERRVIRYHPQKAAKGKKRKPVETVILADLEEYLLAWRGKMDKPSAPLFPTLHAKRVSGAGGLSLTFGRLMNAAGIHAEEDTRKISGKGRRFNNLSFHSLRHTFISLMANGGVPKEIRMKLAGHASNVHERYTHLELETFRTALQSFPRLRPKK